MFFWPSVEGKKMENKEENLNIQNAKNSEKETKELEDLSNDSTASTESIKYNVKKISSLNENIFKIDTALFDFFQVDQMEHGISVCIDDVPVCQGGYFDITNEELLINLKKKRKESYCLFYYIAIPGYDVLGELFGNVELINKHMLIYYHSDIRLLFDKCRMNIDKKTTYKYDIDQEEYLFVKLTKTDIKNIQRRLKNEKYF